MNLLEFMYAPVHASDILVHSICFKFTNFIFQTFPPFVPEMSTSFMSYMTHVMFISLVRIL